MASLVQVTTAFLVLFVALVLAEKENNRASVVLQGTEKVNGHIIFTQLPDGQGVKIEGQVTGLTPGKHGFHIHSLGDLSNGCASTGGHYNPHNKSHGAPSDEERHVGDLGNIEADTTGTANVSMVDKVISLGQEHCILGRAVVVHSGVDDLGKGNHQDSKTTGNAGGRVACGVIGLLSPEEWTRVPGSGATSSYLSYGLAALLFVFLF